MPVVTLRSLKELERVIASLGHRLEQVQRMAAYSAAQWGVGKAVKEGNRKKINASQTFNRSWLARRVKDGAILANSAAHAYFVEMGRKPGKGPPLAPIEQWIILKKLMPAKPPKVSSQASRAFGYGRGVVGDVSGGQERGYGGRFKNFQRTRLRKIAAQRERFYKSETARGYRHKQAIKAMARNISRKIARRGTKARFILGGMLQQLGRRYYREIKRGHAKITQSPPR